MTLGKREGDEGTRKSAGRENCDWGIWHERKTYFQLKLQRKNHQCVEMFNTHTHTHTYHHLHRHAAPASGASVIWGHHPAF